MTANEFIERFLPRIEECVIELRRYKKAKAGDFNYDGLETLQIRAYYNWERIRVPDDWDSCVCSIYPEKEHHIIIYVEDEKEHHPNDE